ncbi:alpha/beta fold hydrolase [Gracilibacillus sp. S3-1-1]|uniref:Alpha/beta fold hydrolase n=1 Tax=Gracilibacillus pellucidus TaxID=3095368 RepID=A0ACC6M7L0_9BACI|nr:alpha/beta fold hydrolase [Gracilibacillus sp. S3-1-1]MDX8046832.1 alpha/beta fold hydrolase [Gracilibacillus sp. S3-1-1]
MSECIKKEVTITHSERTIYGVSYMPEQVEESPIVIFSHGFNGTNKDFIMNAEYLASKGIGAFCFDFCGGSNFSKSDLKTTEMTIFTEKEDLVAIIETISDWETVDEDSIFLFGGSQGGLVSALAAADYNEKIKGLLLLFPAFNIPDNWNEKFPTLASIPETWEVWDVTLGKPFFASIHNFDPFEHIGKYDKNVWIFHGDEDEVVPMEYGKRASKLYPRAELEVFNGEGHGFSDDGNLKVVERAYQFVLANK